MHSLTGSGIPKKAPVKIFVMPENTSVLPKLIEPLSAIAIIKGSNVPKSPSDPDISASGVCLRV